MVAYRYSEWDGTQEIPPLDADEVLESLTDDLMNFGDLQHALRNLLQRGMRNPMGQRLQGMRDLLQQLRQQRRQMLDRYDLNSVFEDIRKRLDEILGMEKDTLQRRLEEARSQLEEGESSGAEAEGDESSAGQPSSQAQAGPEQQGTPSTGERQAGQRQSGQGSTDREFAQMLRNIAERKQNFLSNLPEDVGGQVKELQNYEFMNPEAQHKFQELMEMLKKAMTETFFKDLYNQIAGMSPEDMERMKQMVRELNQMLSEKMAGGEPDFEGFMERYGDLFGPNPPRSLEELIAQMQLQDLLMDKIGDQELQAELAELAGNLEILYPLRDLRNQYPFRGEEELDLNAAMRLMERMGGLDELERQLERTQYGGDMNDIDAEKLREVLGDEAHEALEQLKRFLEVLEEAGYIRRRGHSW